MMAKDRWEVFRLRVVRAMKVRLRDFCHCKLLAGCLSERLIDPCDLIKDRFQLRSVSETFVTKKKSSRSDLLKQEKSFHLCIGSRVFLNVFDDGLHQINLMDDSQFHPNP